MAWAYESVHLWCASEQIQENERIAERGHCRECGRATSLVESLAEMSSGPLVQFLQTGIIDPLTGRDSKHDVEVKLGSPSDWAGRIVCFTWSGPILSDFRDSRHWTYGSLTVGFDAVGFYRSILLNYLPKEEPAKFLPPFSELPERAFSVRDLIDFMRRNSIFFEDNRGDRALPMILTEGGVVAHALGGCSPGSRISWLHTHDQTDS
jgi:hypothetical protein